MVRFAQLVAAPLLFLALLVGCGASSTKLSAPVTPKRTFAGGAVTPPRVAPAIQLHDADGKAVTLAGQRGHYVLVTFLYTHCPDVCPLIAQNLNATIRGLGARGKDVRVLAVSVDPKGDTPVAVRAYTKRLRLVPQFQYLIGTAPELKKTWAAWHVLSVRRSPTLVDHIAFTTLVDPAGKERVVYGGQVHAKDVLHDLHVLLKRNATAT